MSRFASRGGRRKPLAIILSVAIATVGLSLAPIAVSSASATTEASLGADVIHDINAWRASQGGAPLKLDASMSASLAANDEFELEDGGSGTPTPAEMSESVLAPQGGTDAYESENFVGPGSTSSMALELAQNVEAGVTPSSGFLTDNYAGVGAFEFNGRWFADFDSEYFASPLETPSTKPTVTLSGTAEVGQTLTAHSSVRATSDTQLQYDWFGGNGESDGGSTYTVTNADIGFKVSVIVGVLTTGHAVNAGYASSTAVPIPSATPGLVVVTGDRYVGHTLTVDTGTWEPSGTTFAYQWLRDNNAIHGATSSTYDQVTADIGQLITVRVYGNPANEYLPVSVLTVTNVKTGGPTLTNTTAPSITGTDTVGQTLTAHDGTWTPGSPTFTYQWNIDSVAVSGATGSTFVIPASAYSATGKTITVTVTAQEPTYTNTTVTTAATSAVAGLTFTQVGSATVTGTAKPGDTLRAVAPTWSPKPTTITYSWTIGTTVVSTKSSYKIPSSAAGKTLTLEITATKAGYVSGSSTASDILIP